MPPIILPPPSSFDPAGAAAATVRRVARRNRLAQTFSYANNGAGGPYQETFFYLFPLEADAVTFQIAFGNPDTTQSLTGFASAAFAPSTSINDYVNPTGGAGFTTMTWAQAGKFAYPGEGAGYNGPTFLAAPTAVPAIPANVADPVTGDASAYPFVWSDKMLVPPIAPPTSGSIRWMMVRVTTNATGKYSLAAYNPPPSSVGSVFQAAAGGRDFYTGSINFDAIQNPGYITQGTVGTPLFGPVTAGPIMGISYETATPGITVSTFGDSKLAGDYSTLNVDRFIQRSCWALSSPALPITLFQGAWGGKSARTFGPTGSRAMDYARSSIVLIQANSLNGNGLTENYPAAMAAADKAQAQGAVPLFINLPAGSGTTGASLTQWQTINAQLRALAAAGSILLVDAVAIAGNSDGTWQSSLSTDGLHPNGAGDHVLDVQGTRPALQRILAL